LLVHEHNLITELDVVLAKDNHVRHSHKNAGPAYNDGRDGDDVWHFILSARWQWDGGENESLGHTATINEEALTADLGQYTLVVVFT
jgi:glycerophosphoryl diester phosphodiesterase